MVTCANSAEMHVHWVRPGLLPFEQSLNKQQVAARYRLDEQFDRLLMCVGNGECGKSSLRGAPSR